MMTDFRSPADLDWINTQLSPLWGLMTSVPSTACAGAGGLPSPDGLLYFTRWAHLSETDGYATRGPVMMELGYCLRNGRQSFLGRGGVTTASLAAARLGVAEETPAESPVDFDFIFLTDTHLEPELNAAAGCSMCFKKARSIPADFVIQGGDHTFDLLAANRPRATALFDLCTRWSRPDQRLHHRWQSRRISEFS